MDSSRRDKVRRLLAEAQSVPPEEQRAFLEERCEEESVQQEVASLLNAQEEASGFYDALADSVVAPMLGELNVGGPEGPRPEDVDPLGLEGSWVGRYEVQKHLGGGGMGIVYRARDPELGRKVALKFLPPHLSGCPEVKERFAREARAAAALDHAHIATIYEIGQAETGKAEGQPYIAMAFCEGETLMEKLASEGPLSIAEALNYAEQIAEALSAAHEAGIVHRDVKPANVMVTEDGEVKLLDFGLARLVDATRLTETGQQLGTVSYMSPEQARGEEVDPRSDLWALGALVYEMLSGARPFEGERWAAVLHAVVHEEPAPLTERQPEVPAALARVVHRCLQKDPADRYSSAAALREDLRAACSGEGSRPGVSLAALPTGRASEAPRRPADLPRRWIPGGLLFLTVLALAGIWWFASGGVSEGDGPAGNGRRGQAEVGKRSIVVLPFEPLSGGEESEAFARGVHGDLLTRLANISDLKVISRTSVQQYRETQKTTTEIGEELGAGWVLEGEVQESGGEVQVNARLINARTDQQAWARTYQRELTAANLFEIQEGITHDIANSLEAQLTPEEQKRIAAAPTEDLEAYRLYVQGRRLLASQRPDSIRRAKRYFRKALQRDSTYALAWAGLADAHMQSTEWGARSAEARSAEKAAEQALELGPDLAEAHVSRAIVYINEQLADRNQRNGPTALRHLRRAVALKPSYAPAHHWLGILLVMLGRPESGLEHASLGTELTPGHYGARSSLEAALLSNGKYEAALAEARRHLNRYPERIRGLYYTNASLAHLKRWPEIRKLARQSRLEMGGAFTWTEFFLALADVASGDSASARRRIQQFRAEGDEWQASPEWQAALIHGALGELDAAFRTLPEIEEWPIWPHWKVRYYYPDLLSAFRADPRYEKLIRELNQHWGLNPDGSLPGEGGPLSETDR